MPATSADAVARKNEKRRAKRRAKAAGAWTGTVSKPSERKGSPEYRRKLAMMFPVQEMTKTETRASLTDALVNAGGSYVESQSS